MVRRKGWRCLCRRTQDAAGVHRPSGVIKCGGLRNWACRTGRPGAKIKATEKVLGIKLLKVTTGGKGGGGATLTPEAKELISKYKQYTDRMTFLVEKEFKHIFGKKKPV